MRRVICAVIVGIFMASTPLPVGAVNIPVRAGEHDGFTRIVLDLPSALPWHVEKLEDRRRVHLEGIKPEFDLKDSFRRITTDRVQNLRPSPSDNGLDIVLNCDCEVESFLHENRMLVIDIKSKPPLTGAGSADLRADSLGGQTRFSPAGSDRREKKNRFRFPFETGPLPDAVLGIGPFSITATTRESSASDERQSTRLQPVRGEQGEGPANSLLNPAPVEQLPGNQAVVSQTQRHLAAERRLAEQLGRAATQGLVTAKSRSSLPRPYRDVPQVKSEPPHEVTIPAEASEMIRQPGINLRAATSADSAILAMTAKNPRNRDGVLCLRDEDLAIHEWGKEDSFASEIGRLRRALSQEFDRPDASVAARLAKTYLYYGFGAEARRVLEQSGLSDQPAQRLMVMSDVMEFGQARNTAPFDNQFECDSNVALWAVLSHSTLPSGATPNVNAIARSINAMPPRLRQVLGPIASERLVSAGYDEAGAQILGLVERGMKAGDPAYDMASAQLHLAEGSAKPAEEALKKVVGSNTALSPVALIALIDGKLEHGQEIDTELSDLVAAYAQEYRRSELGAELQRVHVLALSATGAFEEAFETMEGFIKTTAPTTALRLRSHAMEALADAADDTTFLKYAITGDDPDRTDLDAAAGNAVASRLLLLGFPEEANGYLQEKVKSPFIRPRALLRARAALAMNRPKLAEAELINIEGDEADFIRARARSASGDHRAAARLFAELERNEPAAEQAWLASDWEKLEQSDALFWQDIVSLIEPETENASGSSSIPGPLAQDRALLEKSASTRRTMNSLLSRTSLEPSSKPSE